MSDLVHKQIDPYAPVDAEAPGGEQPQNGRTPQDLMSQVQASFEDVSQGAESHGSAPTENVSQAAPTYEPVQPGQFDQAGGVYPPANSPDTAMAPEPAVQPAAPDYTQAAAEEQAFAAELNPAQPEPQPAPAMQEAAAAPAVDQAMATQPGAVPHSAPIASPDEDWVASQAAPAVQQGPVTTDEINAKPLPRINIQAFCDDQNTAGLLQNAAQDRRLAKTHLSVQMGGMEAAAHYYRNAPTPNLIIIESMQDRDAMLMEIDKLASVCDGGTKVIVIGHINDVLLYRQLMQRGVSEYLVMPISVPQLMHSLSSLYNDPGADPLGSVAAFVGAKGGVGSSTICHNVAWTISQSTQSDVVIADMDLPFGTAGLDFNQDPVQGISDALSAPERLDEVLLDRLLSRCSDYLSLFAAPGTLDRPYDLNGDACDVVVDVLRKNVPFAVMDVPHVWTDWAQRILLQSDRVVITAIPDLANLRNTKNLVDKLTSARPNDIAPVLVLNQLGVAKRPEISAKDFSNAVGVEPTCCIEFDPQLFGTAANNGQMIEEISAKSKASEQFQLLARLLTDREEAAPQSGSILAPILDRFNFVGKAKSSNKKKAGKS